jgi:hypothetical protein
VGLEWSGSGYRVTALGGLKPITIGLPENVVMAPSPRVAGPGYPDFAGDGVVIGAVGEALDPSTGTWVGIACHEEYSLADLVGLIPPVETGSGPR